MDAMLGRRESDIVTTDGRSYAPGGPRPPEQLLEHEQRALVQPHFEHLSCAFARIVSIGATTSFEVRGVRQEVAYFTSFYLHSLRRGVPRAIRSRAWPRMTRFEDRWHWLVASVVPRFRRFSDTPLIDASLRRIFREARVWDRATKQH